MSAGRSEAAEFRALGTAAESARSLKRRIGAAAAALAIAAGVSACTAPSTSSGPAKTLARASLPDVIPHYAQYAVNRNWFEQFNTRTQSLDATYGSGVFVQFPDGTVREVTAAHVNATASIGCKGTLIEGPQGTTSTVKQYFATKQSPAQPGNYDPATFTGYDIGVQDLEAGPTSSRNYLPWSAIPTTPYVAKPGDVVFAVNYRPHDGQNRTIGQPAIYNGMIAGTLGHDYVEVTGIGKSFGAQPDNESVRGDSGGLEIVNNQVIGLTVAVRSFRMSAGGISQNYGLQLPERQGGYQLADITPIDQALLAQAARAADNAPPCTAPPTTHQ